MAYWQTQFLVEASAAIARTPLGSKIFKSDQFQGLLQKGLLRFLKEDDLERKAGMIDVAQIASGLVAEIYSQDRPHSVKQAFSGMVKGLTLVSQRELLREECGDVPTFFTMNPTQRCNLTCYGCYDGCTKVGPSLTIDEMDYIVSEMKADFGIHFVVISGGEPFLCTDELAELARRHRDVVFMPYTNGTKITPEVIHLLATLGNISPAISLEGSEAFTDERRGRGHFQKMMVMIADLQRAGIVYGFSATMTFQNAHYLTDRKFVQWCIDRGYSYGWFFQYIPIGRNSNLDLMATPEQRWALGQLVRELRREHWPILLADFWNDGWLVGGCIAAGHRYFHINAYGHLKPCVFTQVAIKGGNVREIISGQSLYGSLADAIMIAPLMVEFRKMQEKLRADGSYKYRPCSVIDHPDNFRKLCQMEDAIPLVEMGMCPPGILEGGAIAAGLDRYSEAYAQLVARKSKIALVA